MALQATPYKVEFNLTDLDRGVYENLRFTVARHPSETEERMAARLIAYALLYHQQLAFGRGLSDVDEPALWEKSLDDRVLHWIEVGQPDAERMTWCSRRTRAVQPGRLRQPAGLAGQGAGWRAQPEEPQRGGRAAGGAGEPGHATCRAR